MSIRDVAIRIGSQPGNTAGFKSAEGHLAKLKGMASSVNSSIMNMGAAIVAPFALGKILGDAMAFEKSMSKVQSIFLGTKEEARELTKFVKELSLKSGVGTGEIAEGTYQTLSSGFQKIEDVKQIMAQAQKAVKASGGGASFPAVIDALTTSLQNYGSTSDKALYYADLMNVAVREGKTTFGELADNLGHVITLAPKVGMSFEELMAATASMTMYGGMKSTPEVMTQIANVLKEFISPGKKLQELTKSWGYETSAAAMKTMGFAETIKKLNEYTKGDMDLMGQFIPNIRALKGVLNLVTQGGENFTRILGLMGQATGTTEGMLSKFDTSTGKINKALNILSVTGEEIGGMILPKIAEGIDGLGGAPGMIERIAAAGQAFKVIINGAEHAWNSFVLSITQSFSEIMARFAELEKLYTKKGTAGRLIESLTMPGAGAFYATQDAFGGPGSFTKAKESADSMAKLYADRFAKSAVNVGVSTGEYLNSAYGIAGNGMRRPASEMKSFVRPSYAEFAASTGDSWTPGSSENIGQIVRVAVERAVGTVQNQVATELQSMNNYVLAGGY